MRFGILQRYVTGEVFRAFAMALLTITIVFVLFVVMTEASRMGLTPREIANLAPFVVPSSLPYTVPVSLLFAVTVVYGRLAGDNEVIAVKTAGLSAWAVLWPSMFMGLVLSVGLMYAAAGPIPAANERAKKVIFSTFEDVFYKWLKRDREFNRGDWPFVIKVKDVVDNVLYGATFKHRAYKPPPGPPGMPVKPGDPDEPAYFDQVVQAEKARIRFDIEHDVAHVYLDGADIQNGGTDPQTMIFNDT
ncbi:MAG TPA: LptF/LptG family permease, partial [Isosphaeraceae bacterium]